MTQINATLTQVEKGFNFVDSLPGIGAASASVRVVAFKIQALIGAVLFLTGLVGQAFDRNSRKWANTIRLGNEHMKHGCLNVLRGLGTLVLAAGGLNIGLFIYQIFRKEGFAPIVKYNDAAVKRPNLCFA